MKRRGLFQSVRARRATEYALVIAAALVFFALGGIVVSGRGSAAGVVGGVFIATGLGALFTLRGSKRNFDSWERYEQGQCLACGYDLRGSEGATCPECGAERA